VFFWFIGTAVVTVWLVFRDPAFDYRLLIVGSLLPAVVDVGFGGARVLHSVTFSVVLLAIVMICTRRRSAARRTLMGLPVGTLLHLVFTGAWTNAVVFWWPMAAVASGDWGFDDAAHPVLARGLWNLPLELVGLGLCWWVVRRADLADRARREEFIHTGRLALPM